MATRILAGRARGKLIRTLPGLSTRPLLSRVKKSLFDILGARIEGATFLDLYAGSGNIGLEALSRGAKSCWFVEKNLRCVRVIKENLFSLGMGDYSRVIRANVLKFLPRIKEKFDLIFVGPPYGKNLIIPTLKIIAEKYILTKEGWTICQHHRREKLSGETGQLGQFRQEIYGNIALSFYEYLATKSHKTTRNFRI